MNALDPVLSTPFDRRSLLAAVIARRNWVIAAGIVFFIAGLAAAAAIWRPVYTVSIQMRRFESPLASDVYRPEPIATTALLGMISLPEILHKTGAAMTPPVTGESLIHRLKLTEERTNDLTTVTATGKTPKDAVQLVNLFTEETVQFTREMQRRDAKEANRLVTRELETTEKDRTTVLDQLTAMQSQPASASRPRVSASESAGPMPTNPDAPGLDEYTRLSLRTQAARDQLSELEGRYTDAHPLVKEQKARVAALEAQLAQTTRTAPTVNYARPTGDSSGQIAPGVSFDNTSAPYVALALRLSAIEKTRSDQIARQRATQLFMDYPPGYFQALHTATEEDVITAHNRVAIAVLAVLCGGLGALLAAVLVAVTELFDDRIKTTDDLKRITQLPLLSSLGELRTLSPEAKDQWAYRTWRALQHRLNAAAMPGLVCGFTSCGAGEGRSTWIELIGGAARRAGFRVLTGAELKLPAGTAWGPEQRRSWQETVKTWQATENLVVLVELPPAFDPRTAHLAEFLPAVVWISASRQAGASETIEQLEVLRNSHSRVIAAGLNRDRNGSKQRFARWVGRTAVAVLLLGILPAARAEDGALTSGPAPSRAAWQERLTLGPGDVLNLTVFGQPDLLREQVPVGPDGRISYLEADGIMAAGLTVDELRNALTTELGKFRNSAEVLVTPVAYRSKKYYVLGGVVHRGAYPIQRPMTIIEAVSEAGGLDTGNSARATVGPVLKVDLTRSTLSRQGKHVPVDFEKLFQQGDLTQNVTLEPGDYLYFPTGVGPEVYVLGEVRFPGAMSFTTATGALEAIAARGGFTIRAWRTRILVIRGSLAHPQTFVIDSKEVLKARLPDFELKPKDIVYVSRNPWQKAGEILDDGAAAFVEAAVVTATGLHVDPIGDR